MTRAMANVLRDRLPRSWEKIGWQAKSGTDPQTGAPAPPRRKPLRTNVGRTLSSVNPPVSVISRILTRISHARPADVAQALVPAVSRLVSTPLPGCDTLSETGVGMSADAAGTSACATFTAPEHCEKWRLTWPYLGNGVLSFIALRDQNLMRRVNRWHAPRWIRLWMICATRGGDGWLWYAMGMVILLFGGGQRFPADRLARAEPGKDREHRGQVRLAGLERALHAVEHSLLDGGQAHAETPILTRGFPMTIPPHSRI